ncbi:BatD family protein [Marinobacterium weihaiense]|uniref:BatD family protein n=1 Tax=Marinobacterium weihaiense TaxID=2851016 RepID=A0ABS6M7K9_9GAMM|nr:BatD family protein [Marinobacterium weihaiense]MBV0932264.1 BatD family protein [Marinobacterium weihaiense]
MRAYLLLFSLFVSSMVAAEVKTTVDRYTLTAADTLTLTLETPGQLEQRPDLQALETDFHIQSSQKVIISSHSSASRDVRTRWLLQLRPRNTGTLRIPAIRLGDAISTPHNITVTGTRTAQSQTPDRYMNSLLSQDQVYSHAQLLFTARLFQQKPIPDAVSFGRPELAGALTFTLGEPKRYRTNRDGQSWHVLEQAFALFPSSTGLRTLIGPELVMDNQPVPTAVRETFDVEILEPAHRNSQGYWLPAERVSLQEDSPTPEQLMPGESFVRQITLKAHGLPADALPVLFTADSDSFFAQRDDVSLTENMTAQGLISTRTERIRIEPLGPGALTLPPIDVYWWNTLAERADHASLPPIQLEVAPPALPASLTDSATDLAPAQPDTTKPLWPWMLATTLLTVLLATTSTGWAYSWVQLHRLRRLSQAEGVAEEQRRAQKLLLSHQRAERNTYQALAIACQQNDAEAARLRLVEWGQNFWPEHSLDSLEALCEAARSQTLDFLVLDLDHHLHQDPYAWEGDLLLEAIEKLRSRRSHSTAPEHTETDAVAFRVAS